MEKPEKSSYFTRHHVKQVYQTQVHLYFPILFFVISALVKKAIK